MSKLPAAGKFVFPVERGGECFKGLPKALAKLRAAAGIEGTVTPHTLRHTFASCASTLGYSEHTVAGLLGHRLGTVTARYSHIPDQALRAAADAVSAHLDGMLAGREVAKVESISVGRKRSASR